MKLLLILVSCFFSLSSFEQSLLKYSENNKVGFIDSEGNIVIEPKYDAGLNFSEGFAFVNRNGKFGIINSNDSVIHPYEFDHVFSFKKGVAIIGQNDLYGLIDTTGNILIPMEFQRLYFQREGLIGVKKNDLWGFYTTKGEQTTKIKFSSIGAFQEGLAGVENREGKFGFINKKGDLIIPYSYGHVFSGFNDGIAPVIDSLGRNCYVDVAGNLMFDKYFYSVSSFSDGFAFVRDNYQNGYFINLTGDRVSNANYKSSWRFSNGYCGVKSDSTFKVLDLSHKVIFESDSIEFRFFSKGFGFYCNHSDNHLTWGVMDSNMNLISENKFVKVFVTNVEGIVEFYLGNPARWYGYGKRGYMNHSGKVIWMEE